MIVDKYKQTTIKVKHNCYSSPLATSAVPTLNIILKGSFNKKGILKTGKTRTDRGISYIKPTRNHLERKEKGPYGWFFRASATHELIEASNFHFKSREIVIQNIFLFHESE